MLPEISPDNAHTFSIGFSARGYDEMAYDHLLNLKKRHFFKPAFIDQTIDLHRNQHAAYYGELIWILMVLEMWLAQRQ